MNWFGKFILTVFVRFCCIVGALGARLPVSVLLVLLAKGCRVLFVVAFFGTGIAERKEDRFLGFYAVEV